jgi:hypothetical protein
MHLVAPDRSKRVRDPTWGRGLNKLTKAMGCKMRLSFVEGKKRPEHPVQAAKLASESGIVVRDHMPIYRHWKDYKHPARKDILKKHMGYLAVSSNTQCKGHFKSNFTIAWLQKFLNMVE